MADTLPYVFSEDVTAIQARLKADLETQLGRTLAPADVETLISNRFAYELILHSIQGNEAFRQNLTRYATGVMLDLLCELLGVVRLPAQGAKCTIEFALVDGHAAIQIPAGVRIQSIDGKVIFQTVEAIDVAEGINLAEVEALCQTAGVSGNDYEAGLINIILDPQAFVVSAQNTDTTNGGIDAETDDQLRARFKLAPASFSVAGPKGAYIYFAKSAHPSIVDVACITTAPGEVTLYPLCEGGVLPSTEIKNAVLAICDDEKVRPQNDTVLVDDPDVEEFDIDVELTTFNGAIAGEVETLVNAALNKYKDDRKNTLGVDVVLNQIKALCMIEGKVYDCDLIAPVADIVAAENKYTRCTGISVTITSSVDG